MGTLKRTMVGGAWLAGLLILAGCGQGGGAANGAGATSGVHQAKPDGTAGVAGGAHAAADLTLSEGQVKLLTTAFQAATAIPVNPHIYDRSRSQMGVIETCLKLDQPQRAERWIPLIMDWRRGEGFAALALYWVQHQAPEQAQGPLRLAEDLANAGGLESWCRDVIRVNIAQSRVLMGETGQAAVLVKGAQEDEATRLSKALAWKADAGTFNDQLAELDKLAASPNLDVVTNAAEAYCVLYDRFYQDSEKRGVVEQKLAGIWSKIPVYSKLQRLVEMAQSAVAHHDSPKARDLCVQCRRAVDESPWEPRHRIALLAWMAGLQWRTGALEEAKADLASAMALYDQERQQIIDIDRAGVLRAVAESYEVIQDAPGALEIYRKAVSEGAVNPNARPRAQDLAATCCSMALHQAQPDANLWEAIRQVVGELRDPW